MIENLLADFTQFFVKFQFEEMEKSTSVRIIQIVVLAVQVICLE